MLDKVKQYVLAMSEAQREVILLEEFAFKGKTEQGSSPPPQPVHDVVVTAAAAK